MARTLLGTRVRDVDCALKVFRRDALAGMLPESRGFFVNTEMLTRARQLGLEVVELPVTHRPRAGGASKVSLREVPRTARTLLTFWWREVVRGATPVVTPVVLQARMAVRPEVAEPVPRCLECPGQCPPFKRRLAHGVEEPLELRAGFQPLRDQVFTRQHRRRVQLLRRHLAEEALAELDVIQALATGPRVGAVESEQLPNAGVN